jgi:hypothetical protein
VLCDFCGNDAVAEYGGLLLCEDDALVAEDSGYEVEELI